MLRFLSSALSTLLICSGIHCLAQGAPVRYPLEITQVADLLVTAGLEVNPTDIVYSPQLTASVVAPQLAISAVYIADPSHLRIRIMCSVAGQCLPFFVTADLHDSQHASSAKPPLLSAVSHAVPTNPVSAPVLHAGERAVLLLEDLHMQLKIPVITIDTGKVGAEIRVASLDRKQTYRAVVAEPGVVRGTLP